MPCSAVTLTKTIVTDLKISEIHPSLSWTEKVEWQLLGTTLLHIAGATAILTRRRWEYKQ